MAGVSLRGTVEKREKESVYLKLDMDGADGKALHPYPWIPPTGNVMYCMPQEGTEAYLYFPEAEEGSAYAVSGIHNSSCPVFADAQSRGLVTEHGKKMQMYADVLGFAGGQEEAVQECRMGEDGICFGAGKGKLQVTGSGQITFRAPEISLDAVQKIGQYKMENMAKEKAGMLYPRGGGNPATGGDGYGVGELQNEYNALSSQGILAGTEYEYYKPFDDAPEYEEYKEVPTWLKVVAGAAVAAVVGLAAAALGVTAVQLGMTAGVLTAGAGIAAVAATAASDQKNGTESSLGDYISNAFSASARVGASCIAITLGMYGAEVMTLTVSGGLGLIPVGGMVVTLPQLAGAFLLVAGTVTSQDLLFQMREVLMFCISGKEMGAPTGNWLYDSARELTEMASTQFAFYGLMNPYTYQRPKITPLPNETGLTVPGGTGVAVVPNGTAPALKQPYLPGQYTEYPAAVQGWAQQALPGGGSGIESGTGERLIPGMEGVITGGDSTKLGKNMMESMGLPRGTNWTGHQAQHIIPVEMANHPVLQRIGMDLDDASNGLFLRTPADDISAMSRHRGYHSTYNEFVKTQLNAMDISQSVDVLQKQVYDLQQNLKYLQQRGLPLYPSQGATVDLWQRSLERIQ